MAKPTLYATFTNTGDKLVSVFHQDGMFFLTVDAAPFKRDADVHQAFRVALAHFPEAMLTMAPGSGHGGYFAQEAYANALGFQYAANGIAAQQAEEESPLSGEWAGAITARDIFVSVVGRAPREFPEGFKDDEFSDVEQFADDWEDGYRAAYAAAYAAGVLTAPDADDEV